jgi:hypothetical protein
MTQLKTLLKEKNICSVPWLHTELDFQNDTIKTCSKATDSVGLLSEGLPVVWINQKYRDIRQSFLNEVYPTQCSSCNITEPGWSYKNIKNDAYRRRFLSRDHESNKLAESVYINLKDSAIEDLEPLRGNFVDTKFVTFIGSEPFNNTNVIPLLDLIVSEAKDFKTVYFLTDMMHKNNVLFDKLKDLKISVNFCVKLDGPKIIHEYLHPETNWTTIVENIDYVRKNYSNFFFEIEINVTPLTIGYIPELLIAINGLRTQAGRFEAVQINIGSGIMHPATIPFNVKQQYLEKFTDFDFSVFTTEGSRELFLQSKRLLTYPPEVSFTGVVSYLTEKDTKDGTDYRIVYQEFN